jgi:hypothetical protein
MEWGGCSRGYFGRSVRANFAFIVRGFDAWWDRIETEPCIIQVTSWRDWQMDDSMGFTTCGSGYRYSRHKRD